MKKTYILFVIIIIITSKLFGQEKSIDDYYVDFAIPDISAATLLGISPNNVSRPGDVKEIGIQLLNTFNQEGKIVQGLAVEWSPLTTLNKNLEQYSRYYLLNKIQISLATAKQSKGNGTDLAFGLKWTPIDEADPYNNKELLNDLEKILSFETGNEILKNVFYQDLKDYCTGAFNYDFYKEIRNKFFLYTQYKKKGDIPNENFLIKQVIDYLKEKKPDCTNDEIANLTYYSRRFVMNLYEILSNDTYKKIENLIGKRKEKFLKDHWNAKSFQLSFGLISTSDSSTIRTLKMKRFGSFMGYTQNINTWGQVLFQFQYYKSWSDNDEYKNKFSIGSRVLCGTGTFRGSLEGLFAYTEKANSTDINRNIRTTLGLEFKMTDGLWLETAIGLETPVSGFKNSTLLSLANVKYTFAKKRRYEIE